MGIYVVNILSEVHVFADSPEEARKQAAEYYRETFTEPDGLVLDVMMDAQVRPEDYVEKWEEKHGLRKNN